MAQFNKFHAKPTWVDGIRFASKGEAHRYTELLMLEKAGVIRKLARQPRFKMFVEHELICTYVGDFIYLENKIKVVEDFKGVRTPIYKLKAKLFRALYKDYELREISSKGR